MGDRERVAAEITIRNSREGFIPKRMTQTRTFVHLSRLTKSYETERIGGDDTEKRIQIRWAGKYEGSFGGLLITGVFMVPVLSMAFRLAFGGPKYWEPQMYTSPVDQIGALIGLLFAIYVYFSFGVWDYKIFIEGAKASVEQFLWQAEPHLEELKMKEAKVNIVKNLKPTFVVPTIPTGSPHKIEDSKADQNTKTPVPSEAVAIAQEQKIELSENQRYFIHLAMKFKDNDDYYQKPRSDAGWFTIKKLYDFAYAKKDEIPLRWNSRDPFTRHFNVEKENLMGDGWIVDREIKWGRAERQFRINPDNLNLNKLDPKFRK